MKNKLQLIIIPFCLFLSCSTKNSLQEKGIPEQGSVLENQLNPDTLNSDKEPIIPKRNDTLSTNKSIDKNFFQHKTKSIALTNTCSFKYEWDEVVLGDKGIEAKINQAIRKEVEDFISRSLMGSDDTKKSYCKGKEEYELKGEIVYATNNLISSYVYHYTNSEGAAHGWSSIEPLNFNAQTGEIIKFRDFIEDGKIQNVDTFLVNSLKENYEEFADLDQEKLADQLTDVKYQLSDKGITVIIEGDSYVSSQMELFFTYKELAPYLKKVSPLSNHIQ